MLPPAILFEGDDVFRRRDHATNESDPPQRDRFQKILDVSAAPGSKTTQLAALMNNGGLLLANEPLLARVKSLSFNLERAGVYNAILSRLDGRSLKKFFNNFFDKILLDAPCTGEGTVRKNPEILTRWSERAIEVAAILQKELIESAFHALAVGGELVYSTCTLAPEENEEIADFLLRKFPGQVEIMPLPHANGLTEFDGKKYDASLRGARRIWPHREDSEGFFAVKIKKLFPTTERESWIRARKKISSPFSLLEQGSAKKFLKILGERYGCAIEIPSGQTLWLRGKTEVWLRPENTEEVAGSLPIERAGFQLADYEAGVLRHLKHGAVPLLKNATKNFLELDEAGTREFLLGRDLACDAALEGYVILKRAGYPLGKGVAKKGTLKNQLPRTYVIESR